MYACVLSRCIQSPLSIAAFEIKLHASKIGCAIVSSLSNGACDGRGFCVPLNFWALVPDGSLNEALFRVGFNSKNKKKKTCQTIFELM